MSDSLLAQARAWLADDPDPATKDELTQLLAAAQAADPAVSGPARADLADQFAGSLQFGTAGLRGALGAGPNRMNRVVVLRAAAGLARFVTARGGTSVVIGYDARHRSACFAEDACGIAVAAGLRTWLLPRPLPTPVLAFAVRHLGADAGVMITASHNPGQDNGMKVYLGDGRQIAPPSDEQIAAAITTASAGPVTDLARADEGWTVLDEQVLHAYLDRAARVVRPGRPRAVRLVYTPLHGVAADVLVDAFARAGFAPPLVVPTQAAPDPDFPTVAFPNPEEPGALDQAVDLARSTGADLVLANDPDADRCAVAAPVHGRWRVLTGDEVGALLGEHLADVRDHDSGGSPSPSARTAATEPAPTFASSVVSSTLLAKIAAAHGLDHARTLTGFKWISRVPGLRYGYEEALGYCCDPDAVADKDGVTAALLVAELAAGLKAAGRGLGDALDELARRHGLHATAQVAARLARPADADAVLHRLLHDPPGRVDGRALVGVDDLALGMDGLPPTAGVRLRLAGEAWAVVRPSGTEPKLKCYLEIVVPVASDASATDLAAARREAAQQLAAIGRDVAAAGGF